MSSNRFFLRRFSSAAEPQLAQVRWTAPKPKEDRLWLVRTKVPVGFWKDSANKRRYLDWLGDQLSFKSREDWYKVTIEDFKRHRGSALLAEYRNSPSRTVWSVYQDHEFFPWLFASVSKTFFYSRDNRRDYVDWLKKKLEITKDSDLTADYLIRNHGAGLLAQYGNSLSAVIDSLEAKALEADEAMDRIPRRSLASLERQRAKLDFIGPKIGVKAGDLSPWYSVKRATLARLGCSALLAGYDNSVFKMLNAVYFDHTWLPWKFSRLPEGIWKDPEVVSNALAHLESELKIERPEQWYGISNSDINDLGLLSLINNLGGLARVLKVYRPDFKWEEEKFVGAYHWALKSLGIFLQRLWPTHEIVPKYSLGPLIEVSYLVPHVSLAFDYQYPRDYGLENAGGEISVVLGENEVKKAAAHKVGISIIFVPFWWNRTFESLAATIKEIRPDLLQDLDLKEPRPIPRETTINLSTWRR